MLKVLKFGGTSMADAAQYRKVRDIVRADPARRVVSSPPPANASPTTTRSPTCSICAMRIYSTAFPTTAFSTPSATAISPSATSSA